jgi:hypothetical protein
MLRLGFAACGRWVLARAPLALERLFIGFIWSWNGILAG